MICGILVLLSLITIKGWWPYLWNEWIASTDHKRIGVMYVALGLVMLIRGFSDAIMMRAQLALAQGAPLASCHRSTTTRSFPRTARS